MLRDEFLQKYDRLREVVVALPKTTKIISMDVDGVFAEGDFDQILITNNFAAVAAGMPCETEKTNQNIRHCVRKDGCSVVWLEKIP